MSAHFLATSYRKLARNQSIPPLSPKRHRKAKQAIFFPLDDLKQSCSSTAHSSSFGFTLDRQLLVLEAYTDKAVDSVGELGLHSGNAMMISWERGAQFYVRLEHGVYARSDVFDPVVQPERIGVKAAGSKVQFHPTAKMGSELARWKSIEDVVAVNQDVVDTIFQYNGELAPRRTERSKRCARLRDVLGVISAYGLAHREWLIWLRAIFDETHGSDEGLALADAWLQEWENYPGFDAVEHQWRMFNEKAAADDVMSLEFIVQKLGTPSAQEALYAN